MPLSKNPTAHDHPANITANTHTHAHRTLHNSRNKLTGTLPPEFGPAWPEMLDLEADVNELTGPLPPEWSKMKGMIKLTLRCELDEEACLVFACARGEYAQRVVFG